MERYICKDGEIIDMMYVSEPCWMLAENRFASVCKDNEKVLVRYKKISKKESKFILFILIKRGDKLVRDAEIFYHDFPDWKYSLEINF